MIPSDCNHNGVFKDLKAMLAEIARARVHVFFEAEINIFIINSWKINRSIGNFLNS